MDETRAQEHMTNIQQDVKKLRQIVQAVQCDLLCARSNVLVFKTVLEEYQEQPQLLDAHLEELSTPLLDMLAMAAEQLHDQERFGGTMHMCRMLQCLVNTCGHKTMARFFPNKPPDFQRALALLAHLQSLEARHEIDEDAQDGNWQTTCVLLLWLAVLVRIPFDLSSVRVPENLSESSEGTRTGGLVPWLIASVKMNLSLPGPVRSAAHHLHSFQLLSSWHLHLCICHARGFSNQL
jgi:hypothetical protein